MISAGADVNLPATNGRTPLFVAAEKGLGEMIYRIIRIKDEVSCINAPIVKPSGLRVLHVAAFHNQPHIVSQLIQMGADVNVVDDESEYSPLVMAIIGMLQGYFYLTTTATTSTTTTTTTSIYF